MGHHSTAVGRLVSLLFPTNPVIRTYPDAGRPIASAQYVRQMAQIHNTTLAPSKLELLTDWLPAQPWFGGGDPSLSRVGGFRLDDPAGEVGLEFMMVADGADGSGASVYLTPMTYRGSELPGGEHALIGTTEHGVLGRRWVYDGLHDPVLVAQLLALLQGRAQAQAQTVSDTADDTVVVHPWTGPDVASAGFSVPPSEGGFTPIVVETVADSGEPGPVARIRVSRVLRDVPLADGAGTVVAGWTGLDGVAHRGLIAAAD